MGRKHNKGKGGEGKGDGSDGRKGLQYQQVTSSGGSLAPSQQSQEQKSQSKKYEERGGGDTGPSTCQGQERPQGGPEGDFKGQYGQRKDYGHSQQQQKQQPGKGQTQQQQKQQSTTGQQQQYYERRGDQQQQRSQRNQKHQGSRDSQGEEQQQQQHGSRSDQQQQRPRKNQQQQSGGQRGSRRDQQQQQQHKQHDKQSKEQTRPGPSTSTKISRSESVQSVTSQVSKMSIKKDQKSSKPIDSFETSEIPVTKGTKGIREKIEVNYVDLNIDKMIDIAWQYDVEFEPNTPKKLLKLAFQQFAENVLIPKELFMAFDGRKIAYCHLQVDNNILNKSYEVKIMEPITNKEKNYKITIKETENPIVELNSLRNYANLKVFDKQMRALQCVDIVLRQPHLANNDIVRAGRSFFMQPPEKIDLKDGYELWFGLFQAAVLGQKPFLNIDIAHKAFPSENRVINHYAIQNPNQGLYYRDMENLHEFLRNIEILYQPPGIENSRRYKCNGLANIPIKCKFPKADGNGIDNVLDYFRREKGIRLEYPQLPCLLVKLKDKQLNLPMEFCSIVWGQAINKKTGKNQVREIIGNVAKSTVERKRNILDIFQNFDYEHNPIINKFQIFIGTDFLNIDARILTAPILQYSGNLVEPRNGSWQLRDVKFFTAKTMIKWTILITDRKTNDFTARKLVNQMVKVGRALNMNINETSDIRRVQEESRAIKQELEKCKELKKDMVVVIISGSDNSYSMVKQFAENQYGILTQCIKGYTVEKRLNYSTVQNILLKVNAKLTGVNYKIANDSQPTKFKFDNVMFIGADVTHPSPDQQQIPSVVGVAATYDRHGFQFCMRYRLQDPKNEMIQDMEDILLELLRFYKENENELPTKIIYYRDGVSNGQFEAVRKIEITSMRNACAKIQKDYEPKITCIIVQKRHHTRFFPPPNSKLGKWDDNNNVPPGTIVDDVITHPAENQFFLVSHESIKGVAKPTKYCLIWDDSDIDIDDLQSMTYSLCHMFTRCNRAVSYPAPTYYAHLAAYRGRVYINGVEDLDMENLRREYERRQIKEDILSNNPMFFV